jgi:very-short-patch-repair endonuclease
VERWDSEVESFIVKNLESIQGDERDIVLISTVYGPNADGRVLQNFGPINNVASGWRRLNVLLTRAKFRLELYTSLTPADIIVDERTGRGAKALHDFIEFAGSGRLVEGQITGRPPDSDFEVAVSRTLEQRGYKCVPQVGVGRYFIDIGVIDPRDHRRFLIGIECDGSAYHRTKSARDRDRLRQDVLERLGWRIHRIWSTDWFADPSRETLRLLETIEQSVLNSTPSAGASAEGEMLTNSSPASPPVDVESRKRGAEDSGRVVTRSVPVEHRGSALRAEERSEGSLYSSDVVEALLMSLPDSGLASREEVLEAVAAVLGMPLTKRLRSIVNKTIMNEIAARRLQVDESWTRVGRV